jgi:protein arginine kinase activator
MHYCTACQKAIATVFVMDLEGGAVTGSQHVCQACAEQLGIAAPKAPKITGELIEDLLGTLQGQRPRAPRVEACPGCGLPQSEFRQKGRLGCPRCYETFRHDLMPLLQRIHEAQSHCGRLPGSLPTAEQPDAAPPGALSELRKRLEDAVRGERYEEAARLRDELRRHEAPEEG